MSVDTPGTTAVAEALRTEPNPMVAYVRQPFYRWLKPVLVFWGVLAVACLMLGAGPSMGYFETISTATVAGAGLIAMAVIAVVTLVAYPLSQNHRRRVKEAAERRRYQRELEFIEALRQAVNGDAPAQQRVAEWPDADLSTTPYRKAAEEMAGAVRYAAAAKTREEKLRELSAALEAEQATIDDPGTDPLQAFWARARRYVKLGDFYRQLTHATKEIRHYFTSSWPSDEVVKEWCQTERQLAVNAGFDLLRRALEDGEGDLAVLADVRKEIFKLAWRNEAWGRQALPKDWNTVVARLFLDPDERLFNLKPDLTEAERLLFVGRVLQDLKAPEPSGLSGQHLTAVMLALAFAQRDDVREQLSAEALTTLWTYAGGRNRRGGPPLGWISTT